MSDNNTSQEPNSVQDTNTQTKTQSKGLEVAKLMGMGFSLLLVPVAVVLLHKFNDQISPNSPLQFLTGTFGVLASVCAILGSIGAFVAGFLTLKESRQKKD